MLGRSSPSAHLSVLSLALVASTSSAWSQDPLGAAAMKFKPVVNERMVKLAPGVATIAMPLPAAKPPASAFEDIRTRAAIPHKPFPLMDPKTRKAVGPNDKITLPDGRQAPAGEYWGQVNALEAYLNGLGHTLATKSPLPVLRRAAVNEVSLGAETRSIGAFHKQLPRIELRRFSMAAASAPLAAQLKSLVSETDAKKLGFSSAQYQAHLQNLVAAKPVSAMPLHLAQTSKVANIKRFIVAVKQPTTRPSHPVHQSYPFNFSIGNPGTFQAYLRGKGSVDGVAYGMANPPTADDLNNSPSHFTFHGDATAGGSVFGVGFTLANANADFTTSAKLVTAKMNVTVVGQTIFNVNESAPGKWTRGQRFVKGTDLSTTIPVPIGPITLNVKLGVHGEAGVEYGASVYGGLPYVNAWVDPFVHTSVYAQAGACIGGSWLGVEAGVGANMTLLNADLSVSGEAGVLWFFAFGIREKFVIHNRMDMLSGRVYAYAQFNHPCAPDFWNSCHNTATANLFNWPGFHVDGDLFAVDHSRPLN